MQLAKQAGYTVLATASVKHHEYIKSLGADEVYDYMDSYTPKKIVKLTNSSLKYAVDCISDGMTPAQVSTSLSKDGGVIATLLPYTTPLKWIRTEFIVTYKLFGKVIRSLLGPKPLV